MMSWSPYCEVKNSIFVPPMVALLLIYQFTDLILKSPRTAIECELDSVRVSRIFHSHNLFYSEIDKEKQIYIF